MGYRAVPCRFSPGRSRRRAFQQSSVGKRRCLSGAAIPTHLLLVRQSPRRVGQCPIWRRSVRTLNVTRRDRRVGALVAPAGHRLGYTPSTDTPRPSHRSMTLRAASYPAAISRAGSPPRIGFASYSSGWMTISGGPSHRANAPRQPRPTRRCSIGADPRLDLRLGEGSQDANVRDPS